MITAIIFCLLVVIALVGALVSESKKAAKRDARVFEPKPQAPTDEHMQRLSDTFVEAQWRARVQANVKRREKRQREEAQKRLQEITDDTQELSCFLTRQAD